MHKKANYPCNQCDFKTKNKPELIKHMHKHNNSTNSQTKPINNNKIKQTISNHTMQKSIKSFLSKWTPTTKDIENCATLADSRFKKVPPLKEDLMPFIKAFYVDDSLFAGKILMEGLVYNKTTDRLEINSQQKEKDINIPGDERMVTLLKDIANVLDSDIQMTGDCPSANPNKKMPLLDCQVWMEQSERFPAGQILFSHYRKPMASKLTIQRESALPFSQKITILSQEVFRILRNTHPKSGDIWKQDVSDFAQRMKNSGWDPQTRLRVIKQGITGWFRVIEKEVLNNEPRYRHHNYQRGERNQAKKAKKDNWYKNSENDDTEAVMMIDATPNAELKEIIEKEINKSDLKIRAIERPGPKHLFTMMATNSNTRPKCKKHCPVCTTKNGGNCRTKSTVYELTCQSCNHGYDGQTGRNCLTRGLEHVNKAKSNDPAELEKSVIYKHQRDCHNGEQVQWNMKMIRSFNKKPLDRCIFESIRIAQRDQETSLNSKQEYAQSGIIKATFSSDLTTEKNKKLLIKEAINNQKPKNNSQQQTNHEKPTTKVKFIIKDIEERIKSSKNSNKYPPKHKINDKWPPP